MPKTKVKLRSNTNSLFHRENQRHNPVVTSSMQVTHVRMQRSVHISKRTMLQGVILIGLIGGSYAAEINENIKTRSVWRHNPSVRMRRPRQDFSSNTVTASQRTTRSAAQMVSRSHLDTRGSRIATSMQAQNKPLFESHKLSTDLDDSQQSERLSKSQKRRVRRKHAKEKTSLTPIEAVLAKDNPKKRVKRDVDMFEDSYKENGQTKYYYRIKDIKLSTPDELIENSVEPFMQTANGICISPYMHVITKDVMDDFQKFGLNFIVEYIKAYDDTIMTIRSKPLSYFHRLAGDGVKDYTLYTSLKRTIDTMTPIIKENIFKMDVANPVYARNFENDNFISRPEENLYMIKYIQSTFKNSSKKKKFLKIISDLFPSLVEENVKEGINLFAAKVISRKELVPMIQANIIADGQAILSSAIKEKYLEAMDAIDKAFDVSDFINSNYDIEKLPDYPRYMFYFLYQQLKSIYIGINKKPVNLLDDTEFMKIINKKIINKFLNSIRPEIIRNAKQHIRNGLDLDKTMEIIEKEEYSLEELIKGTLDIVADKFFRQDFEESFRQSSEFTQDNIVVDIVLHDTVFIPDNLEYGLAKKYAGKGIHIKDDPVLKELVERELEARKPDIIEKMVNIGLHQIALHGEIKTSLIEHALKLSRDIAKKTIETTFPFDLDTLKLIIENIPSEELIAEIMFRAYDPSYNEGFRSENQIKYFAMAFFSVKDEFPYQATITKQMETMKEHLNYDPFSGYPREIVTKYGIAFKRTLQYESYARKLANQVLQSEACRNFTQVQKTTLARQLMMHAYYRIFLFLDHDAKVDIRLLPKEYHKPHLSPNKEAEFNAFLDSISKGEYNPSICTHLDPNPQIAIYRPKDMQKENLIDRKEWCSTKDKGKKESERYLESLYNSIYTTKGVLQYEKELEEAQNPSPLRIIIDLLLAAFEAVAEYYMAKAGRQSARISSSYAQRNSFRSRVIKYVTGVKFNLKQQISKINKTLKKRMPKVTKKIRTSKMPTGIIKTYINKINKPKNISKLKKNTATQPKKPRFVKIKKVTERFKKKIQSKGTGIKNKFTKIIRPIKSSITKTKINREKYKNFKRKIKYGMVGKSFRCNKGSSGVSTIKGLMDTGCSYLNKGIKIKNLGSLAAKVGKDSVKLKDFSEQQQEQSSKTIGSITQDTTTLKNYGILLQKDAMEKTPTGADTAIVSELESRASPIDLKSTESGFTESKNKIIADFSSHQETITAFEESDELKKIETTPDRLSSSINTIQPQITEKYLQIPKLLSIQGQSIIETDVDNVFDYGKNTLLNLTEKYTPEEYIETLQKIVNHSRSNHSIGQPADVPSVPDIIGDMKEKIPRYLSGILFNNLDLFMTLLGMIVSYFAIKSARRNNKKLMEGNQYLENQQKDLTIALARSGTRLSYAQYTKFFHFINAGLKLMQEGATKMHSQHDIPSA